LQPVIEQVGPTARQESGKDPSGGYILSVLAKRTYHVLPDGRCMAATEQRPIVEEPQDDPDVPGILAHDTDLYPFKPRTDVVVRGHAYGYTGRRSFHATVRIEDYAFHLLVSGDRRSTLDSYGRVLFSEPAPVEAVPLSFAYAYGGADRTAEERLGNPIAEALHGQHRLDPSQASPFVYPRNPSGCGYLMEASREALEEFRLPNLEDPYDPLSPARLAAGDPGNWLRMPIPHATGWWAHDWFPRIGYFGLVPAYEPMEDPIPEVARGLVPADILDLIPGEPTPEAAFRATCGAAPMLQLSLMRGDEGIGLENLHPRSPRFGFRLPGERPRIWTDGRKGKLNETDPVIHTLVIYPDEEIFTILWRGSAPALRPYLPEELTSMPFRVEWG
jgi:hypothetical protein